ncbi:MAG: hypothetical protein STSR0008_13470 [Ignavibacterium sp.]
MKINKKILVCYNAPVNIYSVYSGKPRVNTNESHKFLQTENNNGALTNSSIDLDDMSEKNFLKELNYFIKSLQNNFSDVESLAINNNFYLNIQNINNFSPDIIFNLVESVEGIASFEAYMAGLYEILDIPYTGNTPQCLANCLNKEITKRILISFNLNTPKYIVTSKTNFKKFNEQKEIKFPVITKLLNEDASIGISENSVIYDKENLKKQLEFLFDTYNKDVIVEEYIKGREFNVAVLDGKILPISEIKFDSLPDDLPKIVTYEGKWMPESVYYKNTIPSCPARINRKTKSLLEKTALSAFNALECRDYARIDIRLSKEEIPFVIEVNPNPDISTDSGFFRAASSNGLTYADMLYKISNCALNRMKSDTQIKVI